MIRTHLVAGAFALVFLGGALFLVTQKADTSEYYRAPLQMISQDEKRAAILFGGDMMFDRTIRTTMDARGDAYIFSCIADLLREADVVVANLEGPITSHKSKSIGTAPGADGNFTFTFPTSTAKLLAENNIRLVHIGNNHSMDFGLDGLLETKRWLQEAGVALFGDPDLNEDERVERIALKGIPFSFVNWSDWTSDKTDHTVAQVRKEGQMGRITVVYAHWGEEYEPPPERVKQLAHSFIDAGAEVVIGSHPHIVQGRELYKDKHIYYSLGNFIFDQYWNEFVRRGLLVRVTFSPKGVVEVEEFPIDMRLDRQTCAV